MDTGQYSFMSTFRSFMLRLDSISDEFEESGFPSSRVQNFAKSPL